MKIKVYLYVVILLCSCTVNKSLETTSNTTPPSYLIGSYEDDYGIAYEISQDTFRLLPELTYEIKSWNLSGQYFLMKEIRADEKNVYARIDWITLPEDIDGYSWAYCMSTYDAASLQEAQSVEIADRSRPKEGCNGFPFSRMKVVD